MSTIAPAAHEQQAVEFARAVRARLSDLPEVELDELLDGLEGEAARARHRGAEPGPR